MDEDDVTWESMRFISLATRFFFKVLSWPTNKYQISNTPTLCTRNPKVTSGFPHKGLSNGENVFMLSPLHDTFDNCWLWLKPKHKLQWNINQHTDISIQETHLKRLLTINTYIMRVKPGTSPREFTHCCCLSEKWISGVRFHLIRYKHTRYKCCFPNWTKSGWSINCVECIDKASYNTIFIAEYLKRTHILSETIWIVTILVRLTHFTGFTINDGARDTVHLSCHHGQNGFVLTHWGRDKMATISQTTISNTFSWMKNVVFRLKFHWSLFPRVKLTIFHHRSR